MSRADRLLELIQTLRRYRHPVSGATLAASLGISLRTLYRDIATLQARGAHIDGAPGLGYVLRPGFLLPPLMFSDTELEALALGLRWVMRRSDRALATAAGDSLAKLSAVLPLGLRAQLDDPGVLVGPTAATGPDAVDLSLLRAAIRGERKLAIRYTDERATGSARTVWPFALGYFERMQVMVAYCELRADIRHFRTDRIAAATLSDERYPRGRRQLLDAWRRTHGIPA